MRIEREANLLFVNDMVHQARTMFTALLPTVELISKKAEDPEEVRILAIKAKEIILKVNQVLEYQA